MLKPLDIIVPVYNENLSVVHKTVASLQRIFPDHSQVTIIIVDDGSDEPVQRNSQDYQDNVVIVRHQTNKGYPNIYLIRL